MESERLMAPDTIHCAECKRTSIDINKDHFWSLDDGFDNIEYFCDGDCFIKWAKKEFDLR